MSDEIFVEGEDYPAFSVDAENIVLDEATAAAGKAFGIRFLFPWQKLVVSNILDSARAAKEEVNELEETTDDICRGRQIVLLPTGYGKSLCFLTPALLLDGPTMVLYPLLALMADQQRRMENGNLKCVVFKGGQTDEERKENFRQLKAGARIILANPEVLQNEELVEKLSKFNIAHIAIDEAHCVSEWGDSFRPAYLTLGTIIKKLNCKVVTAFTATASPPILKRISEVLFDGDAHIIQSGADRANIHYEVSYAYAKQKAVLKAARELPKPMIVFCGTRRRTENMARILNEYFGNGISRFYHAGMTKEEKNMIEQWFFNSRDGILCATCAYGMGVDKSDIQTVIHLDPPEHLENFIQEAGRAGRNGDNVKSVLMWSHKDSVRHRQFPQDSREKAIGDFAELSTCRRRFLLNYLNDQTEQTSCSGCDICDAQQNKNFFSHEATDAKQTIDFIKKNQRLYTRAEITPVLKDLFNTNDIKEFKMNIWEEKDISEIISQLISEKRIINPGGLWEKRLTVKGKNLPFTSRLLSVIPPDHRHHLFRFRQKFLRLEQVLRQLIF